MKRLAPLAALAAFTVLGAACSGGSVEDRDPSGTGAGGSNGTGSGAGTGGSGTDGGAGSGTGGSGTTTPDPTGVRSRCDQTKTAPPTLRRLTRAELGNTIADVFPQITAEWAGVSLGPDPSSTLRFTNDASVLLVGPETAKEILKTAKEVAALVAGATYLNTILPCAKTAGDQACAGTFVDTYGPKLYRRPLTSEERTELVNYHVSVAGRSNFAMGIKWTLTTMLQAPDFLYRSEIGDASGKLLPYEVATELAYTFGGTTPTAELLAKADRGELATPDALLAAAQELQKTEKGREVLEQFFREWTGYEKVLGTSKDSVTNFDAVRASMVQETRRFIDEVVFNTGGDVKALLTAKYTFVDATLGPYYGFGAATGAAFVKADRPANWGVGLLAQGSILAGTAHADFTSPVFRGLLVFSNILCNARPKPPAVVPTIDQSPASGTAPTTRDRFEKLHAQPACAGCHQFFEPFGYAFEHFDETGRYRANEKGNAIRADGSAVIGDGAKASFDGLDDLSMKLAADGSVTDCVSGLMATYAFGGANGTLCLAEEARSALAKGTIGVRDYYLQLAKAPSFTTRKR